MHPSGSHGACVGVVNAWLKTESARTASRGLAVLALKPGKEFGGPRREMKLMYEREWEAILPFREGAVSVRGCVDKKEALAFGFVENVADRAGSGDGGDWFVTAGGRGCGLERYASAIASSNIATASTSQIPGWLMLVVLMTAKTRLIRE